MKAEQALRPERAVPGPDPGAVRGGRQVCTMRRGGVGGCGQAALSAGGHRVIFI